MGPPPLCTGLAFVCEMLTVTLGLTLRIRYICTYLYMYILTAPILGEVMLHSPSEHPPGVMDSEEDSSTDSFSDESEDEDIDEDRCNSAGEEVEEEEIGESHVGALTLLGVHATQAVKMA